MRRLMIALGLLVAGAAAALDVPVQGHRITLGGGATPARRHARIDLRDPAIAAPLPDPRTGTTVLTVHGGAADGQCFAETALDPSGWSPIGGEGAPRGWRWTARVPSPAGLRRLVLRAGRIVVQARGSAWPCGLEAAQRLPVTVTLALDGTRWCAAFGGTVPANRPRRFAARSAPAPAACPKADVTAATLNILHGIFCPEPTPAEKCRFTDRVDLVAQWIAARGCPDVVTLQEIWQAQAALVTTRLAGACAPAYEAALVTVNQVDDTITLSRHPIVQTEHQKLYGNFRHVAYARIDHPLGPLDVFTTHLASGSDGAGLACGSAFGPCPAECTAAGATTVRDCQAVQAAAYVEDRRGALGPALVTGDFNESPGSFVYARFVGAGWTDTYLAAGNPECAPGTGVGCTAGRNDTDLGQLEDPALNEYERIDFLFAVPPAARACTLDGPTDADGDGTATRLFADGPNAFAPGCGPAPAAICWPSDHIGSQADLNCG